uniref:Transmembrane protein 230 n=1 Tax=Paramoeba aestuarina TaxID=180227 RepID=A0A7S4N5V6_9EUKA|mmetsp:Transcript_11673/g.17691  ORF Transcript_11673/g.17691 Transcript_11673/m.17691 type:complete len:106 (+) Transcript_11673:57-374(+)
MSSRATPGNRYKHTRVLGLKNQTPPPKLAICYGFTLFFVGLTLELLAAALLMGHVEWKEWERAYPLILVGFLIILPGAYVSYISTRAFLGHRGYTYADIPQANLF